MRPVPIAEAGVRTPEAVRDLVECDAQHALTHHNRSRCVAGVALGGDRRAPASAVKLHREVAAGAGLLARPLARAGEDAVEQFAGGNARPPASAPSPEVATSAATGLLYAEISR